MRIRSNHRKHREHGRRVLGAAALAALLFAGCGGGGDAKTTREASEGRDFDGVIAEAQRVDTRVFPSPRGQSLEQVAKPLLAVNVGLATSVYTPGRNRLAFGVLDTKKQFVYGPTAVYLAQNPTKGPVIGPIAAPADPLVVRAPFRSRGAAQADDDIAAIYEAEVSIPRTGKWYVLAVSRAQGKSYGAATEIQVKKSDPTPTRGQRAPGPGTDTLASSGGNINAIDTRVPPDDMHGTSLKQLIGKKPVALLFATPQLCQTRVCAPVVDIAAQMKAKYGEQVEFIHQEVYVDNEVKKGLRPPLVAYKLRSEPWLFTIDRQGRVAARLQGSFGTRAFERAVKAAL